MVRYKSVSAKTNLKHLTNRISESTKSNGATRGKSSRVKSRRNTTAYNRHTAPNVSLKEFKGQKILVVADIRGDLSELNALAKEFDAAAIFHVGEFGFYDTKSIDELSDWALETVIKYSIFFRNRISSAQKNGSLLGVHLNGSTAVIRHKLATYREPILSELEEFLNGTKKLLVPVYTTWGQFEDIRVLEKFRQGEYEIANLNIVSECQSHLISLGDVNFRLFGLGGAFLPVKLLDSGDGASTIGGSNGECWITMLQIGKLLSTARSVYDKSEIRVMLSHAAMGKEGLLIQLEIELGVDLSISASLHCRYNVSYNEFSVNFSLADFIEKLCQARQSFIEFWSLVKEKVQNKASEDHKELLSNVVKFVQSMPSSPNDIRSNIEQAFRNLWHFNVSNILFNRLIFEVNNGQVVAEMKSIGFGYQYRNQEDSHQRKFNKTNTEEKTQDEGISCLELATEKLGIKSLETPKIFGLYINPCSSREDAYQNFEKEGWLLIKSIELRKIPKRQNEDEKSSASVIVAGSSELDKLKEFVIKQDAVKISDLRNVSKLKSRNSGHKKKFKRDGIRANGPYKAKLDENTPKSNL